MSAYLFDIDDTLITGYLSRADKDYHTVEALPGRAERLRQLRAEGHQIGLVTNQGGIAFGYNSPADWERKLAAVLESLDLPATTPVACCFSDVRGKAPWNTPEDAARRKPSGAMIGEVLAQIGASPAEAMFIGDRPEDQQAAAAAGVAFQWAHAFFGV